ncbi:MAG: pectate lyase [Verrucomicrobia bacterium]|nr:pectate lyase [Verrucomicrobiota bacterium]
MGLGLTWLLWSLAFLFLVRVTRVFLPVHKFFGPLIYVMMLGGPLLCLLLGIRRLRAGGGRWLGWTAAASGALLTMAFVALMAVPLVKRAFRPQPVAMSRPFPPQTSVPVFPGAEGFGTRTRAGRGGKVLFVTSLADGGPGSLREALDQSYPRTVLFRVGGTIELKEPLFIHHPFVTVAGQTAPGDGILIKNAGLNVMTHDVLVQHLRIRPGIGGRVDADVNDALAILNPRAGEDEVYNVVVDRCSFSWAEDETVSTWYAPRDITLSWCFITEALNRARHPKRTHSAGLLVGDGSDRVSVHHCLLAHNDFRNPLIVGGGTHDFVNNVIYNWGNIPAELYDRHSAFTHVNFAGNTYRPGPTTEHRASSIILDRQAAPDSPRIYVADNLTPQRSGVEVDDWAIVGRGWGQEPAPRTHQALDPFLVEPVTRLPAADNFELVLVGAGATLPRRDPVDQRIVNEVRAGQGRIIDWPNDVGGYPAMQGGPPLADSDQDGLPDDWERAHGLDPHDPADASLVPEGDGYTPLEIYLHALAGQAAAAKP